MLFVVLCLWCVVVVVFALVLSCCLCFVCCFVWFGVCVVFCLFDL